MLQIFKRTNNLPKILTNELRTISNRKRKLAGQEDLLRKQCIKVLEKDLELKPYQAHYVFKKFSQTCNYKHYDLSDTIKRLRALGITTADIYKNPQCMNLTASVVHNFVHYMRDLKFKEINVNNILNFRNFAKKPISLLKLHGYIPQRFNVVRRLCSFLDPNPYDSLVTYVTEDDTLANVHEVIMKSYIVSLGIRRAEAEQLYLTYPLQYKSIDLMANTKNFLFKEFGFDNRKLLQHFYLLTTHVRNIRKIITQFPLLGGVGIKSVLYRYPKLMTLSVHSIKEIMDHLKAYGIADEATQKCYEIFTLSPETVYWRLKELERIPEFEIYKSSPRVLYLLVSQNKAKLRMEMLRNQNFKCSSIDVLTGPSETFERFTQEGNDRTSGSDVLHFLNVMLKVPVNELRENLNCNSNWFHVPIISIKNTLEFLKERGFSDKQIVKVPTILLYKKEQLEDTLSQVNRKLKETDRTVDCIQTLNLCVYLLEKPYHFSGKGLWGTNDATENLYI